MSHFKEHFEGAKTFFYPLNCPERKEGQFRGQKSRGPLKMSREMAHKVIVPKKKIMSQIFLNSGTLVILCPIATVPQKNYVPQFLKQRYINK
jgi:hypothetical protein